MRALVVVLMGCLVLMRTAWADDPQVTIGAKIWANEWTSWTPVPTGINTIDVIESISANTHVAVIPQASLRYDNFLATGSYFVKSNYTLGSEISGTTGQLNALEVKRTEYDGNVGYYVLPTLALTVGYKHIDQDFQDPNLPYKWSGPTVGLAGSAPLQFGLALYGTVAYGRLRLSLPIRDAAGDSHLNADYELAEAGLAYGIDTPLSHLAFSVTAGYRVQVVSTRKYQVSTGFDAYEPVDVHDVTQGPALSVLARF